jgi:hypothetical protein
MNVFDIAGLVLKTTSHVPEESPDFEFERLCTQCYGFPNPKQLEPPKDIFDPIMPGIWPEDDLRVLYDPKIVEPDIDTQMSRDDYGPGITKVKLPPGGFTEDDLSALDFFHRHNWGPVKPFKQGKVFCNVTNTYYPENITERAFKGLFLRAMPVSKLRQIMEIVYPSVACEVDGALGVINDPSFRLPFKREVNNKRKTMDSEFELQEKQKLCKSVVCSAYYKLLFNKFDPESHSAEHLLILRAMCPLLEEDETEEEMV